jgi:hypothetical protein
MPVPHSAATAGTICYGQPARVRNKIPLITTGDHPSGVPAAHRSASPAAAAAIPHQ